jgi:hypothetical protein
MMHRTDLKIRRFCSSAKIFGRINLFNCFSPTLSVLNSSVIFEFQEEKPHRNIANEGCRIYVETIGT